MKNKIRDILLRYWGYSSFRLFQEEAICSILDKNDTLTVLPTGGGKSVCFQLPALIAEGMAVIVSPLVALMKDQVDYLKDMGIAAECLNSSLSARERYLVIEKIKSGWLKLLYLSPERLVMEDTVRLLKEIKLSFFVIDEAHCISHWGHDFREEYRQLNLIKREFNNIAIHAFTATATAQVQKDIVAQLNLSNTHTYIGGVDRPNLIYRVLPRSPNVVGQIADVVKKHKNEPGIIYCLRRSDVDVISHKLNVMGLKNLPYHAGMTDSSRKKNQDDFSSENIDVIVATIAFGMGVDRSNIRYIIHAAMPKSIEHYQQETGRAGRDGLSADCYLFYSGADYRIWEYMLKDSSEKDVMLSKLNSMYNFCVRPECRHSYLSKYFAQEYKKNNCGACDYCNGEVDMVEDPLTVGQKVLSCVARVKERFGANHIADVLKGNLTDAVKQWGHDQLSVFSLMSEETKIFIRFMVEQLIGQGYLQRHGEYMTISITEPGRALLKGEAAPLLAKPVVAAKKKDIETKRKVMRQAQWQGVDDKLFELLRAKRAEIARSKNVPAYIVFSDKTLKDMAIKKPLTAAQFADVFGVGASKQKEYADAFIAVFKEYTNGRCYV